MTGNIQQPTKAEHSINEAAPRPITRKESLWNFWASDRKNRINKKNQNAVLSKPNYREESTEPKDGTLRSLPAKRHRAESSAGGIKTDAHDMEHKSTCRVLGHGLICV